MKSLQGTLDGPEERGDMEARKEGRERERENYFSSAEDKQEITYYKYY